jgi:hypothetical protein
MSPRGFLAHMAAQYVAAMELAEQAEQVMKGKKLEK